MNWKNLKNNKCPKCTNIYLTRAPFSSTANYYCGNCDFRIAPEKFDKIVNDLYKPHTKSTEKMSDEERLSEWNNYGRKQNSEDFSDSPFADRQDKNEEL